MTKTVAGSTTLLLVAAFSLLANPAAAQQANSAVCTGDYICVDSATMPVWPLERWSQVRRQTKRETADATSGARAAVAR